MKKNRVQIGTAAGAVALFLASVGSYVVPTDNAINESTLPAAQISATSLEEDAEAGEDDNPANIDGGEPEFAAFEATAYCDFGITYSGILVRRGMVAADPSILPIGSVVEVQAGDYSGIYTVMDTGGVIKGHIIDIYMPDHEEAIQFGRQSVKVRVLRHGWHPDAAPTFEYSVAG